MTCVTNEAIYQVSDRRLTSYGNGPATLVDSKTNKSIFVDGRTVVGYTGMSLVGDVETHEWFAYTLAQFHGKAPVEQFRNLRDQANVDFEKMKCAPVYKGQVFHAVGWYDERQGSGLVPMSIKIENVLDPATGEWQPKARKHFSLRHAVIRLRRGESHIESVGHVLQGKAKAKAFRWIQRFVKRESTQPLLILQAMVDVIREISHRPRGISRVGPDLLAVRLPKFAVKTGRNMGLMFGPPSPLTPTFLYFGTEGGHIYYGPTIVFSGAVATNVEVELG